MFTGIEHVNCYNALNGIPVKQKNSEEIRLTNACAISLIPVQSATRCSKTMCKTA
jgi:hypothetical protein